MSLPQWVTVASAAGLFVLCMIANRRIRRANAAAIAASASASTSLQISLTLARAVLDHDLVDRLADSVDRDPEVDAAARALLGVPAPLLAQQLVTAYAAAVPKPRAPGATGRDTAPDQP